MSATAVPPTSYRQLLAVAGFSRLLTASFLARLGGAMWSVEIVLFVLGRYHSPELAGLTVLASLVPGLLVSPIAGAALDRWGRVKLIRVDYLAGAATIAVLLWLSTQGLLTPPVLLGLMAVSSLTLPLGMAGARTLIPLIAPRRLWDRANALDSAAYSLSQVAGPAVAGLLVAGIGAELALAQVALLWLAAAVVITGLPEPAGDRPRAGFLGQAWQGVRELWINPSLRVITIAIPLQNVGRGMVLLALPVLVLGSLGGGPAAVGWLLSIGALAGLGSAILAGRTASSGREARLMAGSLLVAAAGYALLAAAPGLAPAAVFLLVVGAGGGFLDVPMFSVRQRAASPWMLGRVLAISMSFNYLGTPLGAALAGPIAARNARLPILAAAVLMVAAAAVIARMLPAVVAPTPSGGHLSSGPAKGGSSGS